MATKKFTTAKIIKGRKHQCFRKGGRYVRLSGDPNREEFAREYWRLMRGGGSLSSRNTSEKLIIRYKQTP
ncbi:hypothetical protein NBRC116597_04860 [Phaeobacter sp. NW0010-22]